MTIPWDNRMTRFVRRHGTQSPRMAMWAGLRSLYRRESVRRVVRPFFPPRRPEKWIFVVGCYNSGTTLTQRLIGCHPDIRTLPWEGSLITSVLPDPEERGWTRMWIQCPEHMQLPGGAQPQMADRLLRDWAPWWGPGGTTFLEKSITNTTRMEWLEANLSPAYFVAVTRDGYCVAEGICRKAKPRPQVARGWGTVYPITMAAEQWVAANQLLVDGSRQVRHYYQLRYEDLLRRPESTLRAIWEFAQLPVPQLAVDDGRIEVNGITTELDPTLNEGSLRRLGPQAAAQITPIIGPLQSKLGYELIP